MNFLMSWSLIQVIQKHDKVSSVHSLRAEPLGWIYCASNHLSLHTGWWNLARLKHRLIRQLCNFPCCESLRCCHGLHVVFCVARTQRESAWVLLLWQYWRGVPEGYFQCDCLSLCSADATFHNQFSSRERWVCISSWSGHTALIFFLSYLKGGQQEEALIFSDTSGSDLATRNRRRPPPRRMRSTALWGAASRK